MSQYDLTFLISMKRRKIQGIIERKEETNGQRLKEVRNK
jgi:hypothetical protein